VWRDLLVCLLFIVTKFVEFQSSNLSSFHRMVGVILALVHLPILIDHLRRGEMNKLTIKYCVCSQRVLCSVLLGFGIPQASTHQQVNASHLLTYSLTWTVSVKLKYIKMWLWKAT
jgi:hypothetical protein